MLIWWVSESLVVVVDVGNGDFDVLVYVKKMCLPVLGCPEQ